MTAQAASNRRRAANIVAVLALLRVRNGACRRESGRPAPAANEAQAERRFSASSVRGSLVGKPFPSSV
jgi:hypothetical protein